MRGQIRPFITKPLRDECRKENSPCCSFFVLLSSNYFKRSSFAHNVNNLSDSIKQVLPSILFYCKLLVSRIMYQMQELSYIPLRHSKKLSLKIVYHCVNFEFNPHKRQCGLEDSCKSENCFFFGDKLFIFFNPVPYSAFTLCSTLLQLVAPFRIIGMAQSCKIVFFTRKSLLNCSSTYCDRVTEMSSLFCIVSTVGMCLIYARSSR